MDELKRMMLVLNVDPDVNPTELGDLTVQLRRYLLEVKVHQVDLIRSVDVPAGAKPVDAVVLGALSATLLPTELRQAVAVLEAWLKNRPVRSVRLTINGDSIDLRRASKSDQRLLLDAFVDRHSTR